MKRIVLLVILVTLAAVAVMGEEDTEIADHVRTLTMTQTMLENLGIPRSDIEDILALQYQHRLKAQEGNREIEERKSKMAEEFSATNPSTRKINRQLRAINQIRLGLEIAQADLYQQTRQMFGEDRWAEVVRGANAQDPIRSRTEDPTHEAEQVQQQEQTQTHVQVQDGSGSGNTEPSNSQSQGGNSGSSGKSN